MCYNKRTEKDIVNQHMQFLRTIKNKRDEGYTTVYLNETWVDINHTTSHHRHSNSGPPSFFLIWSLPRLWYGSLSGSISLNHLSILYNISCYNSLVLLTFVSRSSCRITYTCIYIKVRNNRQNTKRESSLRLDILQ